MSEISCGACTVAIGAHSYDERCREVKQTYDQFVRTVTLDGQRAFGAREDLQIEYDKGFDLYSKAGATRPEMRPYVASFALQLGYDDARDQDRW